MIAEVVEAVQYYDIWPRELVSGLECSKQRKAQDLKDLLLLVRTLSAESLCNTISNSIDWFYS